MHNVRRITSVLSGKAAHEPRRGAMPIATNPKCDKPRRGEMFCKMLNPFMANTFSQIYIQAVFVVEGRQSLIRKENKEELHKYMTGIIQNHKNKLLAIHCMPDHTHVFFGL